VSEQHLEREQRVTPLELFFDLVFVFGFTQVTTVLTHAPTWSGLGHGLLILSALWWAWAAYAWLTNVADPGEGLVWGPMVVAMAAMFVAALAVPEAFGRHGVVFGVSFLIVLVMQLALYALSARGDPHLVKAILRVARSSVAGAGLLVVAGFVDSELKPLLWLGALGVGLFGPLLVGLGGFRVQPWLPSSGFSWRRRSGWRTSTSSRSARSGSSPTEAAPSGSPSRETPTPTCICRWWPASCSSRSR
jgi:low temperature requirement protein LtrA